MRLFVGIPLASEVIEALEALSRSLQSSGDNLRWSSPETWHITLQFLGESSAEKYGCIVQRLGGIRSSFFPVWLSGTGLFDRAGVFWAGVNVSPELRLLEKHVTAATSQCGFAAEDRPYHPHVTLARAKGDDRIRALRKLHARVKQDVEFPPFTAKEFLLYESFLGSGGPRHQVRERFPLGGT
jgi:RNA 2',3'-cyclic 3'-phosphodiesterase